MAPRKQLARAFLIAAVLFAAPADAEDPVAERLYREGKVAAKAGDFALACSRFEESYRTEPAPGTLLNLADCEEHRGRMLDALAHYQTAARAFHAHDSRVEFARKRADDVAAKLAHLTLTLAPNQPAGATVSRGPTLLVAGALGVPAQVDPGEYEIVVRATGHEDARQVVRLGPGERVALEVSAGGMLGAPAPASPPMAAPVVRPTPPPAPVESSPWRAVGWSAIAVGGAGLVLGGGAGVLTLGARNDANDHCTSSGCDDDGIAAQQRGKTWSDVSTVSMIAGAALAAGGAVLVLTHGRTRAQARASGITLAVRF